MTREERYTNAYPRLPASSISVKHVHTNQRSKLVDLVFIMMRNVAGGGGGSLGLVVPPRTRYGAVTCGAITCAPMTAQNTAQLASHTGRLELYSVLSRR